MSAALHLQQAHSLVPFQDVEKLCKNLDKGVHALACLRDNKEKLSDGCKAEVFERQAVAADDWRTDPELFAACKVPHLRPPWLHVRNAW